MTQQLNRPELLEHTPAQPELLRAIRTLAEQYGLSAVSRAVGLAQGFTLEECSDCALPKYGHCRKCDGCGLVLADGPDWDALLAAAEAVASENRSER